MLLMFSHRFKPVARYLFLVFMFQAWRVDRRISKDDWMEWLRHLSVELLKESPSLALKACGGLAKTYTPLARLALYHKKICFTADNSKLAVRIGKASAGMRQLHRSLVLKR